MRVAPSLELVGARAALGSLLDPVVLPRANRLRSSSEYEIVVRRGSRATARSLVLHALSRSGGGPTRVGFVVSRAVGNAATRNLVKRRLRALVAERLSALGDEVSLVVRANPAAAVKSFDDLGRDLDTGMQALARRAPGR